MALPEPSLKPVSMADDPKLRGLRRILMQQRAARSAVDVDDEIEELMADFEGDARAVIKALLHDMDVIVRDYEATISVSEPYNR